MRCAVASCNTDNQAKHYNKSLKLFRFPKNVRIRDIWFKACGRKDKFNINNARICSKHFDENDYEHNLQHELMGYLSKTWRQLKPDAVPSLHLKSIQGENNSAQLGKRKRKKIVDDDIFESSTQTNLGESSQNSLGFEENTSNVRDEDDEPERSHLSDEEVVFESEDSLQSSVISRVRIQSSPKRHQGFKKSNYLIKKKLSPADEMVQIMKANAEYRRLKSENKQTNQYKFDESDMFYLSMSQQAKRLPALDQAKIKLELCNLMQQAEIRQIQNQAISHERSNSSN